MRPVDSITVLSVLLLISEHTDCESRNDVPFSQSINTHSIVYEGLADVHNGAKQYKQRRRHMR